MTFDEGVKLYESFPCVVGLFLGVVPEQEASLDRMCFKAPFDHTVEESIRVARLALERAKRLSERGRDSVLVVYGFDTLNSVDMQRALFGAGRCFDSGSLTVIADISSEKDRMIYKRVATRIIED